MPRVPPTLVPRRRKWNVGLDHRQTHVCKTVVDSNRLDVHHKLTYLPDETGRDPLGNRMSLLDKRILVTAPRQYAQKLCSKLLNAGARPIWVPGVMITQLDISQHPEEVQQMDQVLDSIIQGQHNYTHIAFTSKNGIHALIQRLAHKTGGVDAARDVLSGCAAKLCALGADGQVLIQAGLPVHVSPKEASTQGLVKELQELKQAEGAQVLCPVPLVTGGLTEPAVVPRFLAALRAAGAHPTRLPAYVTSLGTTPQACEPERSMLESGHIEAIAFSSTAEAQGLVHVMGGVDVLRRAVSRHGILLAAHGPYTAQGAAQVLGMEVTCISSRFNTFDGLVDALETAFQEYSGKESHSQTQDDALQPTRMTTEAITATVHV